jgi:UDPglucose 6-dehydrogenase
MKIAIIGTGYVGLPSGVGFAELGHDVVCIDKDAQKIADLNAGRITLFEEGLEELFAKNARPGGRLTFSTDIARVSDAELVILAVGTPPDPKTGEADLQYIYAAAEELAPHLMPGAVVADKSTVPVGTGDEVERIIRQTNPAADFDVISMPEFLREGFAVQDFFHPDRVVVGTEYNRAVVVVEKLYSVFPVDPNIIFVSRRSAELIKYACNTFLSVKLHYINQISDLCEKVGADVKQVAKGMGLDSRIGPKFLNAGPGFGGSCFPKDMLALQQIARKNGSLVSLVDATISGNAARMERMAERVLIAAGGAVKPRIAAWGLAFKNGTDDVRTSPAITIIEELIRRGADVVAFDPKAMDNARALLGENISYAPDAVAAADGADVLAVLTEWPDFAAVDLMQLKMRGKKIVDLRRILDPAAAKSAGFDYETIGTRN